VRGSSTTGLVFNSPTLAFGNVARRVIDANGKSSYVNSSLVVQVTSRAVFLLEYDMMMGTYIRHAHWEKERTEIVAASVNPAQVILALNGGVLVALKMKDNHKSVELVT
jgi:DNA damage-binding protein 1